MQRNPVKEMRFPASLSEVTRGIQAGRSRAYTGERDRIDAIEKRG